MNWKDFFKLDKEPYSLNRIESQKPIKEEKIIKKDNHVTQGKIYPGDPIEGVFNDYYEQERTKPKTSAIEKTDLQKEEKKTEKLDFFKPIYRQRKDIIIFVIENSNITRTLKDEIIGLVKKIIESNKECLFLLFRIGDDKKRFNTMDYDLIVKEDCINNLFAEVNLENSDYLTVLKQIDSYSSFDTTDIVLIDINSEIKRYIKNDINIIFVGSGDIKPDNTEKEEIKGLIKSIKAKSKVKGIKYFCMEDKQSINVAKLGFPVIGHIVTDFYK